MRVIRSLLMVRGKKVFHRKKRERDLELIDLFMDVS